MTQARADAIDTMVKSQFTTHQHSLNIWTGVALANAAVRDMGSNTNPWYVGSGAAVAGASAGNPLPAATAAVVSLTTGLRGRSYNGRVYLWGFTEDSNDAAGGITPTAGTAARNFVAGIGTGMGSTAQAPMAILSRFTTPPGAAAPIERTPPILTPVVGFLMKDNRWDVQRRRAVAGI